MELNDRAEAVARYDALREISIRHQGACMNLVSKAALLAQAKRLGLSSGGHLLAAEDEIDYLFDLCLYTGASGRTRTVDRYARSLDAAPGSDDRLVMDAMLDDRFSLWRVQARHQVAGLVVRDLVRKSDAWLMDHGLEQSAWEGMVLGTRLISPDGFAITCGVSVNVDTEMAQAAYDACACLVGKAPLAALVQDRRFATALYELAIAAARGADVGSWAA